MGLEAVADGLKTRLDTISLIKRVYASKQVPSSLNEMPVAIILPGETSYLETMGTHQKWILRILVLVAKPDQPTALNQLLDFIDPSGSNSIMAAISGDRTLNGSCSSAVLTRNLGVGSTDWAGHIYLSTEFEVEAYGTG